MIEARFTLDLTPLKSLTPAVVKRVLKVALSRAGRVPKAATIGTAGAIKRFGYLAKAIRIKTVVYPSGSGCVIVGPSSTYTRTKGKYTRGEHKGQPRKFQPSKYAHLVERGTKRSKATPFLQPALEQSKNPFVQAITDSMRTEIEKVLAARK